MEDADRFRIRSESDDWTTTTEMRIVTIKGSTSHVSLSSCSSVSLATKYGEMPNHSLPLLSSLTSAIRVYHVNIH